MKKIFMLLVFLGIMLLAAFAQQPPAPVPAPNPVPQLSTADRIALQNCQQMKQSAQKQWQDAGQQEQAVLSEFAAGHPGFHINPTTFIVEADQPKQPTPTVKPALPASEKK
jgi:hypothetical protein